VPAKCGLPHCRWPARPLQPEAAGADHQAMSSPRPATAAKQSTLGVVLALRSPHDRQRELVRASLIARPTVKGTTHRRAA
jgi:hypothetical protein